MPIPRKRPKSNSFVNTQNGKSTVQNMNEYYLTFVFKACYETA